MPIRRRRPLLRAAAVGGGAYYMGKRHAETQVQAGVPPDEAVAPPSQPVSAGMSEEAVQRLQELAELHKQGVLSDEEFASQKALILG
jgi:hypothetical protein